MESIGEPRRLFQDRHFRGAEVCIASRREISPGCWPAHGHIELAFALELGTLTKITEERLGRASLPFFLRPFPGCVPQPEKKRRLFDSHKSKFPHGCRVGRHYIKAGRVRESP